MLLHESRSLSLSNEEVVRRGVNDLNDFADGQRYLNKGSDFMDILNSVKSSILEIGKKRETYYYNKLLAEYPDFTSSEIEHLIAIEENNHSSNFGSEDLLGIVVQIVLKWFNYSVSSESKNQSKLEEMKRINISCLNAVNSPGIEQMIASAEQSQS